MPKKGGSRCRRRSGRGERRDERSALPGLPADRRSSLDALQPVYDAVLDRFGSLGADVARGVKLRHDWGSQYRSEHFLGSLLWLGIDDDAAYVGEPECNGVAECFIRTLKEQCLWSRLYEDVDDLRQGVARFTELYNTEWLIAYSGESVHPVRSFRTPVSEAVERPTLSGISPFLSPPSACE